MRSNPMPPRYVMVLCLGLLAVISPGRADDMAARTRELQQLRFGMFVCWSFSTFSGYEWTPGVRDINFFNPTGFDPDQWAAAAKDAHMGYILLLTKHHDGFCLWDTDTTDRKVTNTKALRGVDVVAAVKKACDAQGLKLALYFSEGDWSWSPDRLDIHNPTAARPEIKKAQLRELLTRYGPIEYIWFDHAVGDGGLSHADTAAFVKSIQPGCFVGFNHGDQTGADIRLGERGRPGPLDDHKAAGPHMRDAPSSTYRLAEFTYPILDGQDRQRLRGAQWFYSLPENDQNAAFAEKIYRDYLGAEKYGNIFSLDVGPDRAGRLREIDVQRLQQVGRYIRGEDKLPQEDVKRLGNAKASGTWSRDYPASLAFDGDPTTRWGCTDKSTSGWIEAEYLAPQRVSRATIDEGTFNRIRRFEVQAWIDGQYKTLATGTTVGPNKTITFNPITAAKFRLNITEAVDVPTIFEITFAGD